MKKKGSLDFLFIGLAYFACYFGAGNLVFPPKLGLQSGASWLAGAIGLAISGIILPLLALVIISYRGGNVESLTKRIHPKLHIAMLVVLMCICMFISIPRTAAVATELGVSGIFGTVPYVPVVIAYFVICFLIGRRKESVLDKIGKYLTPLMVIILFVVVIKGIVSPLGTAGAPTVANPTINAVLTGYQTGDVLVSVLMAAVFIGTVHDHGYKKGKEETRIVIKASIVAFICLFVIYGGLLFIGATVNTEYDQSIGNADLLVELIRRLGGQVAMSAFGVAVILACLTTAIGQLTSVADFYESTALLKGKVSYQVLFIIAACVSAAVATLGLDKIIALAAPIFSLAYAPCLVLMLLGIFQDIIPNDGGFKGAMLLTIIEAFFEMLQAYINSPGLGTILSKLPFYSQGFGWVIPALVGMIAGIIIFPLAGGESLPKEKTSEK
jgi:LIVCS family branched-chain amino acid:cation transporter